MNKNNTGEIIQAMPKIELHLHLEGAFPLESLLRLIQKYGSNEVHNIEELRQKFVFTDFAHFIETWYWKSDFIVSRPTLKIWLILQLQVYPYKTLFTLKSIFHHSILSSRKCLFRS